MICLSRSISSSQSPLAQRILRRGQALRTLCGEQTAFQKRTTVTSAALLAPSGMTVTSPVSGLEPANVWKFFEQLTKIPRPSKHEEKYGYTSKHCIVLWRSTCFCGFKAVQLQFVLASRVLQYLKDFANERKLAWQQDAVGNMVIKRTGSGGGEMAPAVVIQVPSLPHSSCTHVTASHIKPSSKCTVRFDAL